MRNKTLKTFTLLLFIALVSILISQFFPISHLDIPHWKWQWIKEKIFSQPRVTIDYALIGSSHMWCDIHPIVISKKLPGAEVWNLGRNWDGREIDYFIIKRLLEHHNVKNILLQFYDEEVERVHPNAGSIISPAEALAEMAFYLKHTKITDKEKVKERINTILSYFARLSVRVYLQICRPTPGLAPRLKKQIDRVKGFHKDYAGFKQKKADIDLMKSKKWEWVLGQKTSFPSPSRAAFYLDKIHRLCLAYHVNLYFVFVPHYFAPLPSKSTFHYFSKMGVVLIPDIQPIMGWENWLNLSHLFKKGPIKYTLEIVKLLKNGQEASPYYNYYKSLISN